MATSDPDPESRRARAADLQSQKRKSKGVVRKLRSFSKIQVSNPEVQPVYTTVVYESENKSEIHRILITDNGHLFAACSDTAVRQWDLATGECISIYRGLGTYSKLTLQKDDAFYFATAENMIQIWNASVRRCTHLIDMAPHADRVCCITFATIDGRSLLFTGSADGTILGWVLYNQPMRRDDALSTTSNMTVKEFMRERFMKFDEPRRPTTPYLALSGHTDRVMCMVVDDSRERLYSGSADCTIRCFDLRHGSLLATFRSENDNLAGWIFGLRIFGDSGERLLSCGREEIIRTWDTTTASLVAKYEVETAVTKLDIYGEYLYMLGTDGVIRVWNLKTGKKVKEYEGHSSPVRAWLFMDHRLFTAEEALRPCIRCWHLKKGTCTLILRGHEGPINSMQLHEGVLYSASDDGTVRCWDTETLFIHSDPTEPTPPVERRKSLFSSSRIRKQALHGLPKELTKALTPDMAATIIQSLVRRAHVRRKLEKFRASSLFEGVAHNNGNGASTISHDKGCIPLRLLALIPFNRVLYSLRKSQRDFTRIIDIIDKYFVRPLKAHAALEISPMMTTDDVSVVFPGFDALSASHAKIEDALNKLLSDWPFVDPANGLAGFLHTLICALFAYEDYAQRIGAAVLRLDTLVRTSPRLDVMLQKVFSEQIYTADDRGRAHSELLANCSQLSALLALPGNFIAKYRDHIRELLDVAMATNGLLPLSLQLALIDAYKVLQRITAYLQKRTQESHNRAIVAHIERQFVGGLPPSTMSTPAAALSFRTSQPVPQMPTTRGYHRGAASMGHQPMLARAGMTCRTLIREGQWLSGKSKSRCFVFLFNDILVVAKPAKQVSTMATAGGVATPSQPAGLSSGGPSANPQSPPPHAAVHDRKMIRSGSFSHLRSAYRLKAVVRLSDATLVDPSAAELSVSGGTHQRRPGKTHKKRSLKFEIRTSGTGSKPLIARFVAEEEKVLWKEVLLAAIAEAKPHPVFGVPLELIDAGERTDGLPWVVALVVVELEHRVDSVKELFAASSKNRENSENVNALSYAIGRAGAIPTAARRAEVQEMLSRAGPFDVVAILKMLLQKLPEPLVPWSLFNHFVVTQTENDFDAYIASLRMLLMHHMPAASIASLKAIARVFHKAEVGATTPSVPAEAPSSGATAPSGTRSGGTTSGSAPVVPMLPLAGLSRVSSGSVIGTPRLTTLLDDIVAQYTNAIIRAPGEERMQEVATVQLMGRIVATFVHCYEDLFEEVSAATPPPSVRYAGWSYYYPSKLCTDIVVEFIT